MHETIWELKQSYGKSYRWHKMIIQILNDIEAKCEREGTVFALQDALDQIEVQSLIAHEQNMAPNNRTFS